MADICLICGLAGVVSTVIALSLGIRILSKYFKYKQINLLYVGLTFILLWSAWWPSSISFITYLVNQEGLPFEAYIFIGNFFLPFALLTWMIPMCNLLEVRDSTKKLALIFSFAYCIIFDIIVIYFVFNPADLGYLRNPLVPIYSIAFYMLIMPLILIVVLLGLKFAFKSLKAGDKEIRLKGKFLLNSFIIISLGVLLEIFLLGDFYLLISRTIIIIGLILLYIGFIMPIRIKKLILKS
ncbi:MAG: hypothetical protein ACTSR8_20665 [Promethearchaeota archaeon]